uniref:Uncharacterized protein n=1 Tax=Arundo donax TaxID=35708 RepID=A0A0A8YGM2_ARUDO
MVRQPIWSLIHHFCIRDQGDRMIY